MTYFSFVRSAIIHVHTAFLWLSVCQFDARDIGVMMGDSDAQHQPFLSMETDKAEICICSQHPLPHRKHGPGEPILPL
eukprot:m.20885 g.20885  ORF g.20885 m.20885 type:complete len:78 (-) comp8975_c0_seq3:461-694(-)